MIKIYNITEYTEFYLHLDNYSSFITLQKVTKLEIDRSNDSCVFTILIDGVEMKITNPKKYRVRYENDDEVIEFVIFI